MVCSKIFPNTHTWGSTLTRPSLAISAKMLHCPWCHWAEGSRFPFDDPSISAAGISGTSSQQLMQFITNIFQFPKKLSLIKTKSGETKNIWTSKKTQGSQTQKKTSKIHSSRYSGHPSWSLPRPFPCVWPPDFSTQPAIERTQGGGFPMAASRITYSVSGPPDSKSKAFPGHPLEKEGNLLLRQLCQKKKRVWWWRISRKMLWSTLFFVVFWGFQLVGWLIFQDSSNLSPKCFKKTHPSA